MLCLTLYHIVGSKRNILLMEGMVFDPLPPSLPFHLNFQNCLSPPSPQDFQVQRTPTHPDLYKIVRHLNFNLHSRVREKFSYPLILRTSIILNLVVRNPRVLVQNVLLETRNNWAFNVFYHSIILVNCFWLKPEMELVKTNEIATEGRSLKDQYLTLFCQVWDLLL